MNKNILFLIVIALLILCSGLFNYIIDPFEFFHTQKNMNYVFCPRKYAYYYLDTYKNYKSPNLTIGGSNASFLFGEMRRVKNNLPVINTLRIEQMDKKTEYELLKYYLSVHPETECVYLIGSYYFDIQFLPDEITSPPDNKFEKLKQKINILFSVETFEHSFYKFLSYYLIKTEKNVPVVVSRPYNTYYEFTNDKDLKEAEKINFEYTKKTIDLLKSKNIKYKIIFPPCNAAFLYLNYRNTAAKKYIERYKRFLAENYGEIYDFGFINKYTATKIYEKNYLYYDMYHISKLYGNKIFKYFFDEKNAEKDICLILNKNNIDNMLRYENELIEKFIKNNPDFIHFYDNLPVFSKNGQISVQVKTYLSEVPQDAINEINYLQNDGYEPIKKQVYLYLKYRKYNEFNEISQW